MAGNPTEYLSAGFQHYWAPRWQTSTYPEYLTKVQEVASTANGVAAIKVHARQLGYFARQETGFTAPTYLEQRAAIDRWFPDARYVWLRRRDDLRQAVSWAKSMQTNVWWDAPVAPAPFDVPTPTKLRFDVDYLTMALIRMRREDRMWEQFFVQNSIVALTIWYEDLLEDRAATYGRVADFLGIDRREENPSPSASLRRQSDATSERWRARYLAVTDARFESTLAACANVDAGGPDLLVTQDAFERPDGWDESRHSLLALDDYPGPFKPDYQLGFGLRAPQPDLRFLDRPRGPLLARDVPLPASWLAAVPRPALLDARCAVAATLAAHLGADRVGITTPGHPSCYLDVDGCRVLLLDDTPAGLDVAGFLALPGRPAHEWPADAPRLRIVIRTGTATPAWAVSLRNCIAALTRHSCTILGPEDDTSDAADVVLIAGELETPAAITATPGPGGLRVSFAGSTRVLAEPLDWWRRPYRPLRRTGQPVVSVIGPDLELAERVRAVASTALVVNGPHRGAAIVLDTSRAAGRGALVALARGCAVIRPQTAGDQAGIESSVGGEPAPMLLSDDPANEIARLLSDPDVLSSYGAKSRRWVEENHDFSTQWDSGWAPLLHAGVNR